MLAFLKIELRRVLRSKLLWLTLLIGCAITVSQYFMNVLSNVQYLDIFQSQPFGTICPHTWYEKWIGGELGSSHLIGCLQGFTVFQVMTNGNPENTMMPVLLIYKYSGAEYGAFYGYASAMALVLGIIIAILTALNFLVSKKWVHYES